MTTLDLLYLALIATGLLLDHQALARVPPAVAS